MAVLRSVPPTGGTVLHSFSGDAEMAQEAAGRPAEHLGVDGPLTYKKNDALAGHIRRGALERILIEN
jgi:Tat protein secretion system quality control protein TatD with DNase activity